MFAHVNIRKRKTVLEVFPNTHACSGVVLFDGTVKTYGEYSVYPVSWSWGWEDFKAFAKGARPRRECCGVEGDEGKEMTVLGPVDALYVGDIVLWSSPVEKGGKCGVSRGKVGQKRRGDFSLRFAG